MTVNAALQSFPGKNAYLVLDSKTGMEQSYKQLIQNPKTKTIWENGMCKELGQLTQGYNKTQGTKTCKIMTINEIKQIPRNCTVIYVRIIVDYRTQKLTHTKYKSRFMVTLLNSLQLQQQVG